MKICRHVTYLIWKNHDIFPEEKCLRKNLPIIIVLFWFYNLLLLKITAFGPKMFTVHLAFYTHRDM